MAGVHAVVADPLGQGAHPGQLVLGAGDRRQSRRGEVDTDRARHGVGAAPRDPLQAHGHAVGADALGVPCPHPHGRVPLPAVGRPGERAQHLQRLDALLAEPLRVERGGALGEVGVGQEGLHAPQRLPRTSVTTRTSDGVRGVEPNPNRTGGSTGASPPWSTPCQATRAPVEGVQVQRGVVLAPALPGAAPGAHAGQHAAGDDVDGLIQRRCGGQWPGDGPQQEAERGAAAGRELQLERVGVHPPAVPGRRWWSRGCSAPRRSCRSGRRRRRPARRAPAGPGARRAARP